MQITVMLSDTRKSGNKHLDRSQMVLAVLKYITHTWLLEAIIIAEGEKYFLGSSESELGSQ